MISTIDTMMAIILRHVKLIDEVKKLHTEHVFGIVMDRYVCNKIFGSCE